MFAPHLISFRQTIGQQHNKNSNFLLIFQQKVAQIKEWKEYYLFVCLLLGEFIINHMNEILFVSLQKNNVCLYVPVNKR